MDEVLLQEEIEEDGLVIIDPAAEEVDEVFVDEEPTNPTLPGWRPADYRDWRPEDTKVVTYTNNVEMYPRDRPCVSADAARRECETIYGRILETNTVPHRWFFRVLKTRVTL